MKQFSLWNYGIITLFGYLLQDSKVNMIDVPSVDKYTALKICQTYATIFKTKGVAISGWGTDFPSFSIVGPKE